MKVVKCKLGIIAGGKKGGLSLYFVRSFDPYGNHELSKYNLLNLTVTSKSVNRCCFRFNYSFAGLKSQVRLILLCF